VTISDGDAENDGEPVCLADSSGFSVFSGLPVLAGKVGTVSKVAVGSGGSVIDGVMIGGTVSDGVTMGGRVRVGSVGTVEGGIVGSGGATVATTMHFGDRDEEGQGRTDSAFDNDPTATIEKPRIERAAIHFIHII